MRSVIGICIGLWGLLPGATTAQVLEVETIVAQINTEQTGPFVRGLRDRGALSYLPTLQLPEGLDFPKLSLDVAFEGDSHFLTTQGMTVLRSVGLALRDPALDRTKFQIAVRVGATSPPTTALRLSSRRAQVIADHLHVFYGIAPDRMVPVGYGPTATDGNTTPPTQVVFINITEL